MQTAIVKTMPISASPIEYFRRVAHLPHAIFLDSADTAVEIGNYSFIAADPFLRIVSKNGRTTVNGESLFGAPFDILESYWQKYRLPTLQNLPPFQGGAAGYWGYELGQSLEQLPVPRIDNILMPDMDIGFYDCVLAIDHRSETDKAWLIADGFPESDAVKRQTRAENRLRQFETLFDTPAPPLPKWRPPSAEIKSSVNFLEYVTAIEKVKAHIAAGDIYQANIAQQFQTNFDGAPLALYDSLRQKNPAPFAAFLNFGKTKILSVSPERFLQCQNEQVETRPIKGTRPRGRNLAEDAALAKELRHSQKDRAENVMIVDLLRNDLSRVSRLHSVKVPKLLALEKHPNVWHLVSTVTGQLQPDKNPVDLLKATFPGGSITGAPKIRAMEIITDIEERKRGVYCGSIGYLGFDGTLDTSIAIRTMVVKSGKLYFHGGGGIVADSDPQMEYEESLVKVKMFFDALGDS